MVIIAVSTVYYTILWNDILRNIFILFDIVGYYITFCSDIYTAYYTSLC